MSTLEERLDLDGDEPALPEPGGVYDRLTAMVPDMLEELGELDTYRGLLIEQHQARLARVDEQKRKITSLLRALGQEPDKPPKPRKAAANHKPHVSPAILIKIIEQIQSHQDESFTALQLHSEIATWSEPHTYQATSWLRNMEFIGKAGRDDTNRTLYRILDADIGERLKAQLAEGLVETSSAKPHGVSVSRMKEVATKMAELIEQTGGPISVRQVAEGLGFRSHQVRDPIRGLINMGYLSEAGKRRESEAGLPSTIYEIAEPEALDQLKEPANA